MIASLKSAITSTLTTCDI